MNETAPFLFGVTRVTKDRNAELRRNNPRPIEEKSQARATNDDWNYLAKSPLTYDLSTERPYVLFVMLCQYARCMLVLCMMCAPKARMCLTVSDVV